MIVLTNNTNDWIVFILCLLGAILVGWLIREFFMRNWKSEALVFSREVDDWNSKYSNLDAAHNELLLSQRQVIEQNRILQENVQEKDSDKLKVEESLRTLELKNNALQTEWNQLNKLFKQIEHKNSVLEATLLEKRNEIDEYLKLLDKKSADWEALDQKRAELESVKEDLKNRVTALESQIAKDTKERAATNKMLDELKLKSNQYLQETELKEQQWEEANSKLKIELAQIKNTPPVIKEKMVEKIVEVPVDRIVEKIVEVPVDRIVEKIVEKIVEVPVEKIIEKKINVPVDRIVEKIVEVPVDRIVEKIVEKIVEVPVDRIVEKIVEVPVDRIVEKIVEVPVERIVENVIQVPVPKMTKKLSPKKEKKKEIIKPKILKAIKKGLKKQKAITKTSGQLAKVAAKPSANIKTSIKPAKKTISPKKLSKEDQALENIRVKSLQFDYSTIGKSSYAKRDNLQLIVGVGPFIEKKLYALGIYTFEQLSKMKKKDINEITDAIEFFPGRIERDNWKAQCVAFFKRKTGGTLNQEWEYRPDWKKIKKEFTS